MRKPRTFTGGRISKPKDRINHDIHESEVRLIDETGNNVGVVSIQDALRRAQQAGLDLVEVASTSRPIVCKILDYGSFRYEKAKRERDARKKQHVSDVKEIKLRPRIETHDYEVKIRAARKFLMQGDKVKFLVLFRGRERSHLEFGFELLERVEKDLKEISNVEARAQAEGRNLIMVIGPDAAAIKAEKARLEKERRQAEQAKTEQP